VQITLLEKILHIVKLKKLCMLSILNASFYIFKIIWGRLLGVKIIPTAIAFVIPCKNHTIKFLAAGSSLLSNQDSPALLAAGSKHGESSRK